jgi:uncharacterized membrane-anchored protein
MDWLSFFWVLAVVNAIAGGIASVVAYGLAKRRAGDEGARRRVQRIYMVSYVLMSISILCVAFRGLIG